MEWAITTITGAYMERWMRVRAVSALAFVAAVVTPPAVTARRMPPAPSVLRATRAAPTVAGVAERQSTALRFAASPIPGGAPSLLQLSGLLSRLPAWTRVHVTPTVDVESANPGADIERSACVSVAIRANAAYECGDLRLAYALPAIRYRNQTRAPAFLYNSQHARPTPIVRAWVQLQPNSWQPNTVSATLRLKDLITGQVGAVRASGSWNAAGWSTERHQLALTFDATDLTTNLYTYVLEIRFKYSDRLERVIRTGELAIVNRATSAFGRGWWLAGYERIQSVPHQGQTDDMYWVGGDGSTRKYVFTREESNQWWTYHARSLAGTDSLIYTRDGSWRRMLERGAYVRYNASGYHIETVSSEGIVTKFTDPYGCGRLNTLRLSDVSGQPLHGWAFNFDQDNTSTPCNPTARLETSAAVTTDPNGGQTIGRGVYRSFVSNGGGFSRENGTAPVTYAESNGRISSLTDVRGTTTSFFYVLAGLLSSAHTPTGTATDSIKQIFYAGEGAAVSGPKTEADVFTGLYSPRRPAVMEFKRVFLGPWGNPLRIVEEISAGVVRETSILPHSTFPLLPVRVTQPSGYSTYALYNAHGNATQVTADAATPGGPTPESYYRYTDLAHPDNLTSTTDPAGVTTTYTYATVPGTGYPQLETEQAGSDVGALVRFVYCTLQNCLGLPGATISAQDGQLQRGIETYEYDALGNLSATQSAAGKRAEYVNDGIGRLLVSRTRLEMTPGGRWLHDSTSYDALDRVTRTRRWAAGDGAPAPPGGPAPSGAFTQSYSVDTRYLGASGLPVSVSRFDDDKPWEVLSDSAEYDALGRVTRRFAQGLTLPESLAYDPAGNLTLRVTPRGGRITTTYDALNRPLTSITSVMAYDSLRIGTATQTAYDEALRPAFPRGNLGQSSRLNVDGDTSSFTYDVGTGQIATANNRAAQVNRTYLPNGALQSETQRVRTVTGDDFGRHVYTTQYVYDVAGRRTTVSHPTQLAPGNQSERWYYNPLTGRPDSVRDPMDSVVKFRFDGAGQLTRQLNPNNVARQYIYTLDGEVKTDLLAPGNGTIGPPSTPLDPLPRYGQYDGYIRSVTYSYDARGKMLTMNNSMGLRESATFGYSPLGHLRSSQYSSRYYDYTGGYPSNTLLSMTETIRLDALGTTTRRESATQNYNFVGAVFAEGRYNTAGPRVHEYTPNTGRLLRTTTPYATDTLKYDDSGNTHVQQHRDFAVPGGGLGGVTQGEATERVMYYNAADQLVAVDARIGSAPGWSNYLHFLLTFDTYRYDALGRRVLSRSQRLCPTDMQGVSRGADFFVECNLGYVLRTVWDGNKELYEVRMPDQSQHWEKDGLATGDTLGLVFNPAPAKIVDRDAYYGRVGYVYGGAIDKPIVVLRQDYGDRRVSGFFNQLPYRRFQPFALYPQWDQRGEPSIGTSADGGISRCEMDGSVKRCTYAMAWTQVWAPSGKQIDPLYRGWTGSLLQDKREPNGLLYRRNRYLDPASGRFTQPDPIGLAGGLNSYGYAAGDPVSFSDPFGLDPCPAGYIDSGAGDCVNSAAIMSMYLGGAIKGVVGEIVSAVTSLFRNSGPSQEQRMEMSRAAASPDRGGLTRAGRALDKHGVREGSAFPRATGNVASKNAQGKQIVDDIVFGANTRFSTRGTGRFGEVIEGRTSSGRGVRFSSDCRLFICLLEP